MKIIYLLFFISLSITQNKLSTFINDMSWGFSKALNVQIEMFNWDRSERDLFLYTSTGLYLSTYLDNTIKKYFVNNQTKKWSSIFRIGNEYGEPINASYLSLGSYFTGLLIEDNWLKDTGLLLSTSLLSAGISQTFYKQLIGRARPEANDGVRTFKPFTGKEFYYSFPSGHSIVAFTTSFVLVRRVKSNYLKSVFYGLAATTAISRMYDNRHWFSDVLASGFLSYAMVEYTFNQFNQTKKDGLSVRMNPSRLTFSYSF